jgi:uncharacterized membrane protein
MSPLSRNSADERLENTLGNLLRTGVILAAFVVAVGGLSYVVRFGFREAPDRRAFVGENPEFRSIPGVISGTLALHSWAIIQLGIVLLIATPIARVVFAALGFLRQGDGTYALISLIVLAVLLYSLVGGQLAP